MNERETNMFTAVKDLLKLDLNDISAVVILSIKEKTKTTHGTIGAIEIMKQNCMINDMNKSEFMKSVAHGLNKEKLKEPHK